MATTTFNPNELVLERVRAVEEYDISTDELVSRATQIEDPSLQLSADANTVTDAMGAEIATFYEAQTGTFSYTNSLFSLDLAASQFGSEKELADDDNKIIVPVAEIITIGSDHTAVLKYVPVGTSGAEVKYAKVINENNTFGTTYTVGATAADGVFTINAATKTLTFPNDVEGKVFVQYERESTKAAQVTKTTDTSPAVRKLLIHAIFHDPCDTNTVYAGVIVAYRAQPNPESVEINLTSDGKHSAEYKLQKPYCDDTARLLTIIVSAD